MVRIDPPPRRSVQPVFHTLPAGTRLLRIDDPGEWKAIAADPGGEAFLHQQIGQAAVVLQLRQAVVVGLGQRRQARGSHGAVEPSNDFLGFSLA